LKLEGKVCVVTGGASGIGRAAAIALAGEGAAVVVSDTSNVHGRQVAEEINSQGGTAFFKHCDVGAASDAEQLITSAVRQYERLDFLFNNAGVNPMEGSVVDMDMQQWRSVFSVNIDGVFHCSRYAVPEMIKTGGGSILNTASPGSFKGWPANAAYIASKGAVLALTKAMAMDHAKDAIRVNALVPGLILTGIGRDFLAAQEDPVSVQEGIPIGRAGEPGDVAPLIVYLASDAAAFSTGAPFFVDGGELAG